MIRRLFLIVMFLVMFFSFKSIIAKESYASVITGVLYNNNGSITSSVTLNYYKSGSTFVASQSYSVSAGTTLTTNCQDATGCTGDNPQYTVTWSTPCNNGVVTTSGSGGNYSFSTANVPLDIHCTTPNATISITSSSCATPTGNVKWKVNPFPSPNDTPNIKTAANAGFRIYRAKGASADTDTNPVGVTYTTAVDGNNQPIIYNQDLALSDGTWNISVKAYANDPNGNSDVVALGQIICGGGVNPATNLNVVIYCISSLPAENFSWAEAVGGTFSYKYELTTSPTDPGPGDWSPSGLNAPGYMAFSASSNFGFAAIGPSGTTYWWHVKATGTGSTPVGPYYSNSAQFTTSSGCAVSYSAATISGEAITCASSTDNLDISDLPMDYKNGTNATYAKIAWGIGNGSIAQEELDWGTDPNFAGASSKLSPFTASNANNRMQIITGLITNTLYYYRVNTQMTNGQWYPSTVKTFRTPGTCASVSPVVTGYTYCDNNAPKMRLSIAADHSKFTTTTAIQIKNNGNIIGATANFSWVGTIGTGTNYSMTVYAGWGSPNADQGPSTAITFVGPSCAAVVNPGSLAAMAMTPLCDISHKSQFYFTFTNSATTNSSALVLEISTDKFTGDNTSTPNNKWGTAVLPPSATSYTWGPGGLNAGILSISVTNGGSGYGSVPAVTISAPPAFPGGGVTATASAVLDGSGHVMAVNVTNPGSGYTSVPNVFFSGGGGVGAAATAFLPLASNQVDANPQDATSTNNLIPLEGTTYYWRMRAYSQSNMGPYIYGGSSSTLPTGQPFSTGLCTPKYDLSATIVPNSLKNSIGVATQFFSPGETVSVEADLTNKSGAYVTTAPGSANANMKAFMYYTGASMPNCSVGSAQGTAPKDAANVDQVWPISVALAPGATERAKFTFTIDSTPNSYTGYVYVIPSCSFAPDLGTEFSGTWGNNQSGGFSYTIGVNKFFNAIGGDVGAANNIAVGVNSSCLGTTVSSIAINNPGTGYSQVSPPTVTIDPPTPGPTAETATAYALVSPTGIVTAITVLTGGCGYASITPPGVTIVGSGTLATATATVTAGGTAKYQSDYMLVGKSINANSNVKAGGFSLNYYNKPLVGSGVYNYFASRFRNNPAMQTCSALNLSGSSPTINGYFACSGDLTISSTASMSSYHGLAVIFVDGNLYVNDSISYSSVADGVVFIVKGSVIVHQPTVSSVVLVMRGVFIARKGFYDNDAVNGGTAQCTFVAQATCALLITGAVYVDGEDGGKLELGRIHRLSQNHATISGDTFTYDPKYLMLFNSLLTTSPVGWKETSP